MQIPQLSWLPHPSEARPHFAPKSAHVLATHGLTPHLFGTDMGGPPQLGVAGFMHAPQSIVLPHPSLMTPHVPAPTAAQVFFTQPHWFGVPPPPHVLSAIHVPQLSTLPQPSLTVPHVAF